MTMGLFVLVVLSLICGVTRAAVIVNGDFSTPGTPPAGWTTDSVVGDPPTGNGEFALFTVTGFSAQQLQQPFLLLPGNAQTLSFEFLLSTADDGTTGSATPDNFQATLFEYDAASTAVGNSLLPSPDPSFPAILFPAFFSTDNVPLPNPKQFKNAAVTVEDVLTGPRQGWKRVSVDVSSVPSQDVMLDFSLFGDNDGLTTTVSVDNVELTVSNLAAVPEPGALLIWMGTGLAAAGFLARRSHFVGRVPRRTRRPNTIRRTP